MSNFPKGGHVGKPKVVIDEDTIYHTGPQIPLDYDYLYNLAEQNKEKFRSAEPFPHIVFDNFLNEKAYMLICDNHQVGRPASGEIVDRCIGKYVTENRLDIPKRVIFYQFGAPKFIKFLNILTGIDDLELDVNLREAGYTTITPGGYLQVHKDFTHNSHTDMERRLNLFIFLNDNWEEQWGGSLSFWDIKTGNEVSSYLPIGNRCVIFQASNIAYHGHPEPLCCPENVLRKSFSTYYYTESTGIPRESIHFLREELNE